MRLVVDDVPPRSEVGRTVELTTPDDVLDIARSELGVVEHGDNEQKFGQWYGINSCPWCAIFVSYCFYNAGLALPATSSRGFASAEAGREWFSRNRQFQTQPKTGDVIFYHFDGEHAGANHVGIVESVDADGVQTIEGNTPGPQSNAGEVMRKQRSFGGYILGYGRPGYGTDHSHHVERPSYPQWPGRILVLTSPHTRGDDVRRWQAQMQERGWKIDVTGEYDDRSDRVCRKFQQEKGLHVDGAVGPKTWAAAWDEDVT